MGKNNALDDKTAVYYTRVSAADENALESFELIYRQVEHVYPGIKRFYIDRGRDDTQLQEMLSDAQKGEFDVVICKNVSRLGRNLIRIIQTVKELNSCGVAVFFEVENMIVDGTQSAGIEILAMLAEEETQKKSRMLDFSHPRRLVLDYQNRKHDERRIEDWKGNE